LLQRLYDWVIELASHRRAPVFLSILSFTESSVFPVPPDVMLVPMCLARPRDGWRHAFLCTAFSVLGGMAGYFLGRLAFDWVEPWLLSSAYADTFNAAVAAFRKWGFWYILLAGFTPIPYKVFTISAGVVGMPLPVFVAGSALGRGGRFMLVAGLISLGGEKLARRMRAHIDLIGWTVLAIAAIVFAVFRVSGTSA
jgi:membrane protein YqaA with SNARE-associated domain